jgi:predicted enzyme related to lactoylglutathione lyase
MSLSPPKRFYPHIGFSEWYTPCAIACGITAFFEKIFKDTIMTEGQMNPVIWFEIPVTDLMRASAFYQNVFNHSITFREKKSMKMGVFPLANAPGISGALVQVKGYTPHHSGTVVYFFVNSIENTLEKVINNGGKLLIPKTDIGEEGYIAQFEDSEGNQIGIYNAKELPQY